MAHMTKGLAATAKCNRQTVCKTKRGPSRFEIGADRAQQEQGRIGWGTCRCG